jgi:crotonobetainyl-CoA:carnitine CoA-transferase CaiB-like acyl-CoA transferase
MLPLDGVLVLDFSQFLAGPVAALRLADLGARVVKIERPGSGEIGRTLAFAGRYADGDTLSFHAMNRNKEGLTADLKDPRDLEKVRALVRRADVLIQNFRPGVMERLGLDHASARRENPGIVYASASGYGDSGPLRGRAGQDLLAQSVSGLPWQNGTGDRPVPVGLSLADHLMSCHLAHGVTALLVRKARTGRGGLVETSLLEGVLDLQRDRLAVLMNPGLDPGRTADGGIYATEDGHLAVVSAAELSALLRAETDLDVTSQLRTRTTAHWTEVLDAAGICCAPVLGLEELLEHPGFTSLQMTQPVMRRGDETENGSDLTLTTTRSPIRIDGRRLTSDRPAPKLGQHGAFLAELGWPAGA